jgi:hypothetical protein
MKNLFNTSQKILILLLVFTITLILISNDSHPLIGCKSEDVAQKQDSIVPWKYPEASSIPDNEEGKLITQGRNIFIEKKIMNYLKT